MKKKIIAPILIAAAGITLLFGGGNQEGPLTPVTLSEVAHSIFMPLCMPRSNLAILKKKALILTLVIPVGQIK